MDAVVETVPEKLTVAEVTTKEKTGRFFKRGIGRNVADTLSEAYAGKLGEHWQMARRRHSSTH